MCAGSSIARRAVFSRSRSTWPISRRWSRPKRAPPAPSSPRQHAEGGMSRPDVIERPGIVRRAFVQRAALLSAAFAFVISAGCTRGDDPYWIGAAGRYEGDEPAHENL